MPSLSVAPILVAPSHSKRLALVRQTRQATNLITLSSNTTEVVNHETFK